MGDELIMMNPVEMAVMNEYEITGVACIRRVACSEGSGLRSLEATGQYRVVQWVGSPPRKGLASRRIARPWEASSNDRF